MIKRYWSFTVLLCCSLSLIAQWENAVVDILTENSSRNEVGMQSLQIDDQNTLHLIWQEVVGQSGSILYYAQRPVDGNWSLPEIVLPDGLAVFSSALAVNKNTGIPFVISQDGRGEQSELVLATRTPEGIWIQKAITNSPSSADLTPDIALDASNTIHITWAGQNEVGAFTIKYATLSAFLSDPVEESITASVPGTAAEGALPKLAVTSDGTAHISFRASRTGIFKIVYANNNTEDSSWLVETVPSNNEEELEHSIAVHADSIVYIITGGVSVFSDQWRLSYRSRRFGTTIWALPRAVVTSNRGTLGAMFVDENGQTHCLVDELESGLPSGSVLYATNPNGVWRTRELVGGGQLIGLNAKSGQLLIDDNDQGFASVFVSSRTSPNVSEIAVVGADGTISTSLKDYEEGLPLITNVDYLQRQLNISWSSTESTTWDVQLIDIQGKILAKNELQASSSIYSAHFPLHGLTPGIYGVIVEGRNILGVQKILINR